MAIALERGDTINRKPEINQEVTFIPVSQLDLAELAKETNGTYANELVVWAPEDGVANAKLTRKNGFYKKRPRIFHYLTTETYRDEVSNYTAVFSRDGSTALIDSTDPLSNTILGFVIRQSGVDRIMGNESKFADTNPEYITARNMGWQARLEAAKANN